MIDFAPGMRTIIRDEEWMIKKIETNSLGNKTLYCIGISPLVKDREAIFLTDALQHVPKSWLMITLRFLQEQGFVPMQLREEKRFEVVGGDKKRPATKKKSDLGWIDRLEEIDAALDDF